MSLAFWRDVSIVWLALQSFILLIVPLAISYFAVRGMRYVLAKLPPLFHQAQTFSSKARNKTEDVCDQIASPLISAHSRAEETKTVFDQLLHSE